MAIVPEPQSIVLAVTAGGLFVFLALRRRAAGPTPRS
jgi:hypothetical protein